MLRRSTYFVVVFYDCENMFRIGIACLRCFQQLLPPNVTTQRCFWRNNWSIIGLSYPVLSYKDMPSAVFNTQRR